MRPSHDQARMARLGWLVERGNCLQLETPPLVWMWLQSKSAQRRRRDQDPTSTRQGSPFRALPFSRISRLSITAISPPLQVIVDHPSYPHQFNIVRHLELGNQRASLRLRTQSAHLIHKASTSSQLSGVQRPSPRLHPQLEIRLCHASAQHRSGVRTPILHGSGRDCEIFRMRWIGSSSTEIWQSIISETSHRPLFRFRLRWLIAPYWLHTRRLPCEIANARCGWMTYTVSCATPYIPMSAAENAVAHRLFGNWFPATASGQE